MHSFSLDERAEVGAVVALPQEEKKHAMKVLRLEAGSEICLIDGFGGRFLARLTDTDGNAEVLERLSDNEPPVRVTLYEGFPKADKLDLITQKVTELGAARVVPVKMSRCVVKLDEKDGRKRRERLERIAQEAAKQCRRARATEVSEPLTWKQAFTEMEKHDLLIVPWEDASAVTLKDMKALVPDAKDIGVVIGPEGGMSAEEVAALEERGARPVTLGPRILRTETAALASVTLVMALWGDLV